VAGTEAAVRPASPGRWGCCSSARSHAVARTQAESDRFGPLRVLVFRCACDGQDGARHQLGVVNHRIVSDPGQHAKRGLG
jgi:hypothetical protein